MHLECLMFVDFMDIIIHKIVTGHEWIQVVCLMSCLCDFISSDCLTYLQSIIWGWQPLVSTQKKAWFHFKITFMQTNRQFYHGWRWTNCCHCGKFRESTVSACSIYVLIHFSEQLSVTWGKILKSTHFVMSVKMCL